MEEVLLFSIKTMEGLRGAIITFEIAYENKGGIKGSYNYFIDFEVAYK